MKSRVGMMTKIPKANYRLYFPDLYWYNFGELQTNVDPLKTLSRNNSDDLLTACLFIFTDDRRSWYSALTTSPARYFHYCSCGLGYAQEKLVTEPSTTKIGGETGRTAPVVDEFC